MRSVRKRRRHFPTVRSWTRIHGQRASQDDLASLGQRPRDPAPPNLSFKICPLL
jgi:hypothetical protein